VVVPRARVWHRGGGSQGGAVPRATLYAVRNHLTVAARASCFRAPRVIWPLIVGYHLAHVLRTPARRSPAHLAAIVRGAWHAWRRQLGEEA
jgi:hypothetical protein